MRSTTVGFVQIGLAASATALAVWVTDVAIVPKVTAALLGLLLGTWAGTADGRSVERRVDRGGGVVLYAQDAVPYALLWPFGALALTPFAIGAMTRAVVRSPELQLFLQAMVVGMTAAWLAHEVLMARTLRRMSIKHGPLQIQWFHGRSVVGPEGMLGKTGEVTPTETSEDYVRIAGELWRAESVDGSRLSAGQQVVVTRVNGLLLLVEAANKTASNTGLQRTAAGATLSRRR